VHPDGSAQIDTAFLLSKTDKYAIASRAANLSYNACVRKLVVRLAANAQSFEGVHIHSLAA
jgi:hypothetical protein